MQKLYKQFVESVTKWEIRHKIDEFFVARARLTFYYSITTIVILGAFSFITYNALLTNLTQSILESDLDSNISQLIIDNTQDILLNRFLTIDFILVFSIIILGFFLTHKTLEPIKTNMQKQKRFIADASHELRTPIAVVISGLEVNLSNKKLDLPTAKKTLENTLNEMREFSKLSNDLLDLSKYDSKKQNNYESIIIDDLIKTIVEKNKNLTNIKNIEIKTNLNSNTIIKGNKIELSRVFLNILDNAIKNTPQNGIISLSSKITFRKYCLNISDNGVGIKKDMLEKIFDPFFQGDNSRNTNGAGLGLTLAKKIIENHKGEISIKSEENKGTNVQISLPIYSS